MRKSDGTGSGIRGYLWILTPVVQRDRESDVASDDSGFSKERTRSRKQGAEKIAGWVLSSHDGVTLSTNNPESPTRRRRPAVFGSIGKPHFKVLAKQFGL
jgi:hypothetical protein